MIKKLDCKYKLQREEILASGDKQIIGDCPHCSSGLLKTDGMSDEELLVLIKDNPKVCLFLDYKQKNISHIERGVELFFNQIKDFALISCNDCKNESKYFLSYAPSISQCQSCGEIHENNDKTCCAVKDLKKDKAIFCKNCKSTNISPKIFRHK